MIVYLNYLDLDKLKYINIKILIHPIYPYIKILYGYNDDYIRIIDIIITNINLYYNFISNKI